MARSNKMCPICFVKQLLTPVKRITDILTAEPYDNGVKKPPMGWSSWNCFRNNIDEKQLLSIGDAMANSGLVDLGYRFLNLDDCWQSSQRDENGEWQSDYQRFPSGIPALIGKLNAKGIKVGLYSSNGTLTCEDLPASLGREQADAMTLAKWGAEYFKYDYCHNKPVPRYAPLIALVTVAKKGESEGVTLSPDSAHLEGYAKVRPCAKMPRGVYLSGLDRNLGAATFENVCVNEDGEYSLTVTYRKAGDFDKFLMVSVNGGAPIELYAPGCKIFNYTARIQTYIKLNKGNNTLRFFNPVANRADGAMLQYRLMGRALKYAAEKTAADSGTALKPITYSICEWGRNKPYLWGKTAGNLWRTTMDIRPWWWWINWIYNHTVKLYRYSGIGAYNDPDMLEVGNGKLTEDENRTHFSLWCMMNAPLILGNDLRKLVRSDGTVDKESAVLRIVTNKELIALNQDGLGKAAKRVVKGGVDVLAKPLKDGVAICFYNKGGAKSASYDVSKLVKDEYVKLAPGSSYTLTDLWNGNEISTNGAVKVSLRKHGCAVYKIKY